MQRRQSRAGTRLIYQFPFGNDEYLFNWLQLAFSHCLELDPWTSKQFLSGIMVIFFTSNGIHYIEIYDGPSDSLGLVMDPPATLYMGRDKVESA